MPKIISRIDSTIEKEILRQAYCYTPRSVVKEVSKTLTREELENFYADTIYWAQMMENWAHHISYCSDIYKLYNNSDYTKVVCLIADELIGGSWSMDHVNAQFNEHLKLHKREWEENSTRNHKIQDVQHKENKVEGLIVG